MFLLYFCIGAVWVFFILNALKRTSKKDPSVESLLNEHEGALLAATVLVFLFWPLSFLFFMKNRVVKPRG